MSISDYAFVSARVGAMKSYLLDDRELRAIAEARNFEDSLSLLKGTAYGKGIAKLSSPSLIQIERVLTKSLIDDYITLVRSMHGDAKDFLEQRAKRFEISCIKALFIMKTGGGKEDIIPYGRMSKPLIDRLSNLEVDEIVEELKFTEYYAPLRKALQIYKGDAFPFIVALDGHVYKGLCEMMDKLHGKDREMVKKLIGTEIDAKNLVITLRLRGLDERTVWEYLIPYRYRLKDEDLRMAFNISRLGDLPSQLPGEYRDILVQGIKEHEKTGTFFELELKFKKYIIKMNERVFCGDRFHIGVPIAYLNLKENEIRNLVAILKAKEEALAFPEIEKLLI